MSRLLGSHENTETNASGLLAVAWPRMLIEEQQTADEQQSKSNRDRDQDSAPRLTRRAGGRGGVWR